jgi:hypothetical protein
MECGVMAPGQLQAGTSYLVLIVPCEGFSEPCTDKEDV